MKVFVVLFMVILAVSSKPNNLEALIDEINTSQDLWKVNIIYKIVYCNEKNKISFHIKDVVK